MFSIIFVLISLLVTVRATVLKNEFKYSSGFDQDLYNSVLDSQKCEQQLNFMANNFEVAFQFIDASGKMPNGILMGNLADLGNYHQCLAIRHSTDDIDIEGKYCMLNVPLNQNFGSNFQPRFRDMDNLWPTRGNNTITHIDRFIEIRNQAESVLGARNVMSTGSSRVTNPPMILSLGICIPKTCHTKDVIDSINFLNMTYQEQYCRLPGDKPMSIADYLAISVFSLIILLTTISTAYDMYQIYVLNKDNSQINKIYRCFSLHTNTRRLLTFNKSPGALECIDGIRAISMVWVVIGHTYYLTIFTYLSNSIRMISWLTSFTSTWVNAAPISVDTFFMLGGILCVYSIIGNLDRRQFLKSLHLFYLHRLLRLLPLLAAVILLQASLIHRVSDGPAWYRVASPTEFCRKRWWAALLHVQNYIKPLDSCLPHTWYLSVDVQLYIFSPLVIVWLFGSTLVASCSLGIAILISLVITTTYSFLYNYPAAVIVPRATDAVEDLGRVHHGGDYFSIYYINTLTRASPFIIGMMYGYILSKLKGRKIRLNKSLVAITWVIALAFMSFCILSIYPIIQVDHKAQMFDNFLNSYMRGMWALAVGWLIFACSHGYGGPVNWFLSLYIWKVPARISYAMYLIHYPIILIANGSMTSTYYFSDANTIYRGVGDLFFTMLASFVLCVFIDAPFSTIQKLLFDGKRKPKVKLEAESQTNIVETNGHGNKMNI